MPPSDYSNIFERLDSNVSWNSNILCIDKNHNIFTYENPSVMVNKSTLLYYLNYFNRTVRKARI